MEETVKSGAEAPKAKFMKARLARRTEHSHGHAVFFFEPEVRMEFKSGQYCTIGMQNREGKLIERAYSICSSPYEDGLELFIELVEEGALTPLLFHDLKVGGDVSLRPRCVGKFLLDRESGRKKHLMVATVTGIAPFVSHVRTRIRDLAQGRAQEDDLQIVLLQGASYLGQFAYREEMEKASRDHARWLTYIPTVSRPTENPDWTGETGRVETLIEKTMGRFGMEASNTTAYLCGHPGMIEFAQELFAHKGFSKDQVREEAYWQPKK